jgi:uncharacterized protein
MSYAQTIASTLNVKSGQVTAVITLLDDGNTIPFIARYRKEATGSLDEEQIRQINDQVSKLRALDERRSTILESIASQEKLTPELEKAIHAAASLTELEDLYLPYKPKRRTRAMIAREKGLEPLAEFILGQLVTQQTAVQIAAPFLNEEVPTPNDALAGARDIVAETISDTPQVRQSLREKALQFGLLRSQKIDDAVDERAVYKLYYDFELRLDRLRPYQILAINRGEEERICASAWTSPSGIGFWRSAPASAPTAARRWPNSSSWPWMMPPNGCSCPPSSGTCAARSASRPKPTPSRCSPKTCAACSPSRRWPGTT